MASALSSEQETLGKVMLKWKGRRTSRVEFTNMWSTISCGNPTHTQDRQTGTGGSAAEDGAETENLVVAPTRHAWRSCR